jgi:hypothetical protein
VSAEGYPLDGYRQDGVVHGRIDVLGEPAIDLTEVAARRWHRWTLDVAAVAMGPIRLPAAMAHTGVRAPFAFPDGTVLDAVLTAQGWAARGGPRNDATVLN